MSSNRDVRWRAFEQVVAAIEESLRPRGAVVRSPDRITDRVTGRRREVDATVRLLRADGTTELTVIECRRRRGRQDDPWIEQLATRREKLGADRTIAVASVGFSKSAQLSARHYGIELKTLKELVNPVELQAIFGGYSLRSLLTDFWLLHLAFVDSTGRTFSESELAPLVRDNMKRDLFGAKIFVGADGLPTGSLNSAVMRIGDRGVKVGEPPVDKSAVLAFKPRSTFVFASDGLRELRALELVVRFVCHEHELTKAYAATYSSDAGPQSRILKGEGTLDDGTHLEMSVILGPRFSGARAT